MREKLSMRRPSGSMVVAIVALVFALAGTGVASVGTISSLSKKEKKQTRRIARGEIKKAAPGLSVASAINAQTAQTASTATSADSAQPVAFAHVSAAGVIDPARSKNVGSVTAVFPGFYCITGVPFTPLGGQATVDQVGPGNVSFAQFGFTFPKCQAYVETYNSATQVPDPVPFYVVLYG
ncbi:MAG: hypothetical protein U0R71_14840 [Solirubrobacterales bacterium]